LKYFYLCLKNFLSFFYYYNFEIYKSSKKSDFKKMIITWGKFLDFDNQGNFFDRYNGKKSSKEKNRRIFIKKIFHFR